MGISISPGNASWSYSGFHHFREQLAKEEGFNLNEMSGFGGTREWETANGQHITPLTPLLHHSDCDGYLRAYECEEVAPRLRLILDRWAEKGGGPDAQYNVQNGRELLAAMEHSIEHGCALTFG